MGFTTIDTVRLLLIGPSGSARRVLNERISFDDNNHIVLAFLPVEENSVILKGSHRNELSTASQELNGTDWSPLPFQNVIPDTVAIASDKMLSSFFVEGKDFQVDYEQGQIRRIAGGNIVDHNTVLVFCQTFDQFSGIDDYQVDCGLGVITRLTSGTIMRNEIVWVDYTIAEGGATDTLIQTAIDVAHSQILSHLRAPYTGSSTDALLASGEAELACAVVARTLAAKPLATSHDSGGDDRALAWLKVAENFERSAWIKLQPFLVQPRRQGGYAVKNG